ncbi:MAG: ABC transporter substrate-binding protein [Candidatus Lokiarchaeota archaeon]|nr:ABC transporter substrate-binding protein [Candidatus Lokiarchaeota archaeon]
MTEHKTPKEKKSGKKLNLAEHKKTFLGGGLILAVAIAGITTGIFLIPPPPIKERVFIWGTTGLATIDPMLYGNGENFAILENIVETLFGYEFSADGPKIVQKLALGGNWSPDHLNYTCFLRQGVTFHDGSPFNASAVKWNLDRIYRLKDYIYWAFWVHPDGTPILNFTKTRVIDQYTIRFVLNKPFFPFEALLGAGPKIVSPLSTPYDNFSNFVTDKLVGTGPFEHYSSDVIYDSDLDEYYINGTTLLRYDDYWGETPNFDKIVIKIFDNATKKAEALLSGEIQGGQPNPFDPIVYENAGLNLFNWTSTEVYYICMNNDIVNNTMRKAISYALDYDRLVPLGMEFIGSAPEVTRARSPLSLGMLYSNWKDFELPVLNITRARQVLKEANLPGTADLTANDNVSAGNEWERLVEDGNPLARFNFSYVVNWDFHREMALLFQHNLTQIGINITITPRIFPDYRDDYFSGKSQFILYGWQPDYNDPSNNMHSFTREADDNLAGVNDTYFQDLLENAAQEYNETLREQEYLEIQQYFIEELCPVILWYTPLTRFPLSSKIAGYNLYNNWNLPFYEWYFLQ